MGSTTDSESETKTGGSVLRASTDTTDKADLPATPTYGSSNSATSTRNYAASDRDGYSRGTGTGSATVRECNAAVCVASLLQALVQMSNARYTTHALASEWLLWIVVNSITATVSHTDQYCQFTAYWNWKLAQHSCLRNKSRQGNS